MIGLYKAELVHRRGPWRGLDDLELATLEWVDWYQPSAVASVRSTTCHPPSTRRNQERETGLGRVPGLNEPSLH